MRFVPFHGILVIGQSINQLISLRTVVEDKHLTFGVTCGVKSASQFAFRLGINVIHVKYAPVD